MADSGGEEDNDDVEDLLHDTFLGSMIKVVIMPMKGPIVVLDTMILMLRNYLTDMEKTLFSGCEDFLVLSFLLRMMHVKVTCKMSNIAMDMMLQLLNEAFKMAILPKNHYEAKKYLCSLRLGYESIHACENDCALFLKENEDMQICPV